MFSPLTLRDVTLRNRIAMSPMCMYSAEDGIARPWHGVHLASRAAGGAGLVISEATAVTANGRITPGDLGIWSERHAEALAPVAALIRENGAVPGIQLSHAGRKGGRTIPWEGNQPISESEWGPLPAPSPLPFRAEWNTPKELGASEIEDVVESFAEGAQRAVEAGFDVIELHAAHGYLLHQFLSPLSNHRGDAYGGDAEARARLLAEVVRAVRRRIGETRALFVRIPLVDWADGGITIDDTLVTAKILKNAGVDLLDCSSGANVPDEDVPVAPFYHVPMTSRIREGVGIRVGAVGLITEPDQADAVITEGQADLVLLGRALLRDAYWPCLAAEHLGGRAPELLPKPYRRAVARMGGRTQW